MCNNSMAYLCADRCQSASDIQIRKMPPVYRNPKSKLFHTNEKEKLEHNRNQIDDTHQKHNITALQRA
jgi:hypothetical protein